ncbi:MAG TPA: amidohydrolase family protein [Geminicoccaceae bacterium]|nr:amidohydrolase family protein [Geminicoccus sp.]HMU51420.1 amidohydrolase family protein [Geminicoccaceae bacterium]
MTVIDAHCHAWEYWPYQPPVPDPESRGRIEQLLFEMDQNGVDRAVVICAGIDHNPRNNDYIAEQVRRWPDRLIQFADIDCKWSATHHTPGAAERLIAAVDRYALKGFTHYLAETPESDGSWLLSPDGVAFLQATSDRHLILSLACAPHHLRLVADIARRWRTLPILLHHMARVRGIGTPTGMREMLHIADCPNVHVKISGFGYAAPGCAYPYDEVSWLVRMIHELVGPERMCWGSDYPVVRRYMTYAQALAVARRHAAFLGGTELALVFGGTMQRLLGPGR